MVSEVNKKIAVVQLCRPLDLHPDQLLASAVLKQQGPILLWNPWSTTQTKESARMGSSPRLHMDSSMLTPLMSLRRGERKAYLWAIGERTKLLNWQLLDAQRPQALLMPLLLHLALQQ